MLLEICASNYQSALNAQKAGAHRIELCSELAVGGITPSYGLLKKVMEELTIPVMVLIRPRSGNFVYNHADFDIMKRDIELCKELGCAGIVSGVLTADFKIDIRRTSELIELARPLPFTFHRAFDHVVNPEQAVVDLVNLGAKRILTSGQHTKAIDGIENLKRYQEIAGNELSIMPGGVINAGNCSAFAKANFKEVHASATEISEQTNEEKIPMNSPKFLQENIEVISNKNNIAALLKILKKWRISILLVLVIFISSCKQERPNVERQYLESNWLLHKAADYSLISDSVQVPSTVHKELLPFIKHPFQGNNEDSLQWITEENWVFETYFKLDQQTLQKEHIELHFEGIDTYASIELNGHHILETDNAFLSWKKDVKPFLEEENELYVTIKSPLEIEEQKAAANPYTLPEGNQVYTRKAQYQYGWDWGPKLNTMGIWKPVYLEAYDDFKIDDVYIKQNFIKDSTANLTAQIKLSQPTEDQIDYQIKVNDSLYSFKITDSLSIKKAGANQEIHFEIPQVQLWWPHNIGEPYLYDIEVLVSKEGKLIDSQKLKTGIRIIELVNEPDYHGTSFFFKVNDVPVYMKGANYIPQNSMQDLVTDDHYEKLLSDAKEANMNMLRVWGGGIYENDIFYEKCDEKGILVWQDFMFACAMYPGDARFRESVTNEITQQITRLRNHSSIALWCGNNETSEAWHNWGWQEGRSQAERDSIWEDYRAIFQIAMPKYVSELTKEPYWESSPEYGRGNPKYEFEGDAHDWRVWHDAYPFEHFEEHVPRFMSEFGFQSHPSYEAIRYINENGTINIQSDDYASHQKHARGNELIREYMDRDFPVPTNDEDYVYVSQLLQAYGMSKGIQAHRRERPYNMGTLYWQLNDCWPAVSWSSIDYFGNWKALHYQVKRDFENVLISNVVENDVLKTYIINDNQETVVEDFKIEIISFKGNVIYRDMLDSSLAYVKANYSEVIHSLKLKDLVFNRSEVYIKTTYGSNEKISFFEKPKELNLPKADVVMKSPKTKNGYQISLKSDVFTKDVFLYSNVNGHFSDNFFNLEPNVEKTLYFETNSDEGAVLHMKSLNVINCKYGPIEDTEYCY